MVELLKNVCGISSPIVLLPDDEVMVSLYFLETIVLYVTFVQSAKIWYKIGIQKFPRTSVSLVCDDQ
jgi:hypothetical protein